MMAMLRERIAAKVVLNENGCWLWTGSKNIAGYGYFNVAGKRCLVHRVSYELIKGPIPHGLEIDHLCRIPSCVNPDHLEAVTHRINILRGVGPIPANAAKTHCHAGHPLYGPNLYLTSKGGRDCRACKKIAFAKWMRENPERHREIARQGYLRRKGTK